MAVRNPALAALSPTFTSSSGTPTATLDILPVVLNILTTLSFLGRAILAPVDAIFTLAVVLALSLRGRVLASLALLSRTIRSSSRIRRFSASFSRFTLSSSCLWNAVSSYRDVAGIMDGDITSLAPGVGVAEGSEVGPPDATGGERRVK